VPLTLYRRHRQACEAGHIEECRSGQFEERKKGWRRCACFIFASGTLAGRFSRKYTGKSDWDEAKAVATVWESAGSWDGVPTPQPLHDKPPQRQRITLADAAKVFLTSREAAEIAPATMRKYRTFNKQLTAFAADQGYVMLDQFSSADIDVMYSGWKLGPRAKGKRLGTLRSFFRFCMNRKWLEENPVTPDIRPPMGANRLDNKAPFSDDELHRIIDACDALGAIEWINDQGEGAWTGEDAKDFIWTLTYTGLRISDVALFDIKRLQGNEVFLRAKKNGGDVFAYVPDWLRDRLIQRSEAHGPAVFL
jgi:integrase